MRVLRVRVPLEYSSSLPEHTKKKIEQRLSGVGIGRRQSKHSHMFTRTLTNTHSLTHSLTQAIALSFPIRIEISFEFALNVCFVTTCGSPTLCLPSSLALEFAPYTYLYILYMYMEYGLSHIVAIQWHQHILMHGLAGEHFDPVGFYHDQNSYGIQQEIVLDCKYFSAYVLNN